VNEKAEWEVWLDDSYQWRVGFRICWALNVVCLVLLLLGSGWWLAAQFVFLGLGLAFLARENYMVNKAVELRLKEQDDGEE